MFNEGRLEDLEVFLGRLAPLLFSSRSPSSLLEERKMLLLLPLSLLLSRPCSSSGCREASSHCWVTECLGRR